MYSLFRGLFISSADSIGITGLRNFRLFEMDIPCRVNHQHPEQSAGCEHISHDIRFGPLLIRIRAELCTKETLCIWLQHFEHNPTKSLTFVSQARGNEMQRDTKTGSGFSKDIRSMRRI
jgi:hypothetical protein